MKKTAGQVLVSGMERTAAAGIIYGYVPSLMQLGEKG